MIESHIMSSDIFLPARITALPHRTHTCPILDSPLHHIVFLPNVFFSTKKNQKGGIFLLFSSYNATNAANRPNKLTPVTPTRTASAALPDALAEAEADEPVAEADESESEEEPEAVEVPVPVAVASEASEPVAVLSEEPASPVDSAGVPVEVK